MASERSMRKMGNELIGNNIKAEVIPSSFEHKDGGEVIKETPVVYVPHLWKRIEDALDENDNDITG